MGKSDLVKVRVRWAETDAAGIVHHTSFFLYMEVGRTEFLRHWGPKSVDWRTDCLLPLVKTEVEFLSPVRFDDILLVYSTLEDVGNSSVVFSYQMKKTDGIVVCRANTTQVAISPTTRLAIPAPAWLRTLAD